MLNSLTREFIAADISYREGICNNPAAVIACNGSACKYSSNLASAVVSVAGSSSHRIKSRCTGRQSNSINITGIDIAGSIRSSS